MKELVIGVTGASGMIYAARLLAVLEKECRVHLIISETAEMIAGLEGISFADYHCIHEENADLASAIASGSFRFDGMVIIPCSMKTLGGIAHGISDSLIGRAADVCLKERRPLILVPRETPYSRVHLTNMLAAHDAGAVILPASPPFYQNPGGIEDLADMIVQRVLDHLRIDHTVGSRWSGYHA
ncbi:MAG: UbiX family flavin prenyltransferase [Methanocalculus sp. MSAO_Arc1]|uniref:UbiX family flavin prenyltransferase n=1 Tax=Methanocalculus TaxID=71151 RepID=UPI000FEEB3C9|nr:MULTISPECIES: UbiX family flavin prenyltransferase [unclassified Methanocalculus]MCP1662887.1 4-hydroxy-3-polyprenylbenzoate decarboxylase [Methanocalculus sp. AMF5]RQD80036.1 MAG: UbiX family flavin prenyltransferase [Methanocalculus sp. MSAO_Arc1]